MGNKYRQAVAKDAEALVVLWWKMQASHHEYEHAWYADKGEGPCKASWREHFRRLLQDDIALGHMNRWNGQRIYWENCYDEMDRLLSVDRDRRGNIAYRRPTCSNRVGVPT